MLESLDKLMLAGLGALSVTQKRAEKIFDELVSKGKARRGNRPGFVKDLTEAARQTRRDIENMVSRQVRQVVTKLNLATREDLRDLKSAVMGSSAPSRRKTRPKRRK